MTLRFAIISFAVLASGCAALRPDTSDVIAKASASEFGSSCYGCDDTIAVARAAGYDYRKIVDGCLRRDGSDLHVIFELTTRAPFDAASAQGHAAVLGSILRRQGDTFFGGVLSREPEATQVAVRDYLQYDFAVDEREVAGWYPITFTANASAIRAPVNDVPASVYRQWHEQRNYYALVQIIDAHIHVNGTTKAEVREKLGDGLDNRDGYPNAGPDFWVYPSSRRVPWEHYLLVEFDQRGIVKEISWASE
ncbi:MAG: hypothetical protein WD768_07145 [Phycisphaeraceae bacterium]